MSVLSNPAHFSSPSRIPPCVLCPSISFNPCSYPLSEAKLIFLVFMALNLGAMPDLCPLPNAHQGAEVEGIPTPPRSPKQCGEHRESLSLFCVDDLEPVCRQCAATFSHEGHRVYPITEAWGDCKVGKKCIIKNNL